MLSALADGDQGDYAPFCGSLLPLVVSLKAAMQGAVRAAKDQVGFIVAGLKFLDRGLADVEAEASFGGAAPEAVVSEAAGAAEKRPAAAAPGAKANKRRKKAALL